VGGPLKKRVLAFHRFLDGDRGWEAPFEWLVSRVCEEFSCVPSVAIRELEELPGGLIEAIMAYRSYKRRRDGLKAAEAADDSKEANSAAYREVLAMQFEVMKMRRLEREEG
jgi:hypothetical protein